MVLKTIQTYLQVEGAPSFGDYEVPRSKRREKTIYIYIDKVPDNLYDMQFSISSRHVHDSPPCFDPTGDLKVTLNAATGRSPLTMRFSDSLPSPAGL